MARFYGAIGYEITKETRPGIYEETYIERMYKGDVIRNNRRWNASEYLNDNLEINNEISVIADGFATAHFGSMRYVRLMKQTFEITSVTIDVERHRLVLSIGGVFNVPERVPEEANDSASCITENSGH